MVAEDESVLEREVEVLGGLEIGTRRGHVYGTGPNGHLGGGYSVHWAKYTTGTAVVELQKHGGAVRTFNFESQAEAEAEFERIKGELFLRQLVEWVAGTLTDAGIVPAEFRGAVLAGELDALLGAADLQEERGESAAALLLRSAYHRVRGEANVEVRAGKGVVIVLNPVHVTPKCPAKPAVGDCRAAVVAVGVSVRVLSVETKHDSVKGDDGRYRTAVRTLVADRTFRLGDHALYHSYNLAYFAPVEAVTAKTVVIAEGRGRSKRTRFTIAGFVGWNHDFDAAKAAERNANWSD